MGEDDVSADPGEETNGAAAPSISAKLSMLVIGGIAIAGIVLMCLTVLLLVLLGDE